MSKINMAVIGVGRMGSVHARNIKRHHVRGAKLSAICDIDKNALDKFVKKYGRVNTYTDYKKMISAEKIDAVIIATEHYFHPDIAIYCINHGVHVLVEKPLAVTTYDAKRVIECANKHENIVSAVMYNQRTNPLYAYARDIINNGEIGKIQRINFIVTDWYRSQAYYNQGGWRASLWGEGGGTLINQCVHQIDLLQWITGMPKTVRAKLHTKGRNITTENDVTAVFGYDNDVYCTFTASTHELRGTNRLEIAGEKGRIVIDLVKMTVYKFNKSETEVNETTKSGYGFTFRKVKKYYYAIRFLFTLILGQQIKIVRNFVNAIRKGDKLISPIADGINAVEMINGMYLSNWENKTISIPIDDKLYKDTLIKKIEDEKNFLGKR